MREFFRLLALGARVLVEGRQPLSETPVASTMEKDRKELLLRMYDQMWSNVTRHIGVTWQSAAALVAAFAVLGLVEKGILTIDFATSLVVLVSLWQIAHIYDASSWCNRNLVIIANIERQFLLREDTRLIHFYFARHREATMLRHFDLQLWLGVVIAMLVLLYHFTTRVWPARGGLGAADWSRALPYLIVVGGVLLLVRLRREVEAAHQRLLEESPGGHWEAQPRTQR